VPGVSISKSITAAGSGGVTPVERVLDKYLLTREEIDQFEGVSKTHFLNENAKRVNKSLGDLTGLTGLGVHIIEIQPGHETTEFHRHYHEDECVYILEGTAEALVGDRQFSVKAGDFIGYRAGGEAHSLRNNGIRPLKAIVVGQRLDHDVGDYPNLGKRIYRQKNLPWNLVDIEEITQPSAGKKV
jgi:uncharacterized cupin superfamily protein